jgi:hypothetical protein
VKSSLRVRHLDWNSSAPRGRDFSTPLPLRKFMKKFFTILSAFTLSLFGFEEDGSVSEKERELKIRENQLEIRERELELREKGYVVEDYSSDTFLYFGYRYGSGQLRYQVDSDRTDEIISSKDSYDTDISGFKVGLGGLDDSRVELNLNHYLTRYESLDKSYNDERFGFGLTYITIWSGRSIVPYFSLGVEYLYNWYEDEQYDNGVDSNGDIFVEGSGINLGFGFYLEISKNLELGIGYEYKLHQYKWEYSHQCEQYDSFGLSNGEDSCETETVTRREGMGLANAEIIFKF